MIIYFKVNDIFAREALVKTLQSHDYNVDNTASGGVIAVDTELLKAYTISSEKHDELLKNGNLLEFSSVQQVESIITGKVFVRATAGKPQYSLLDFDALLPTVRALEYGLEKYERDNWKKPLDREGLLNLWDCTFRHLKKIKSIIENPDMNPYDLDSKVHHVGALGANSMFLAWHLTKMKGIPATKDE